MTVTNTKQLTETQEELVAQEARAIFEKKFTEDFWHFSFEGTRLCFQSKRFECVFEVHSEAGSFCVTLELSEQGKALKKTFKAIELE